MTTSDGIFFCNCKSPHYYDCFLIDYSPLSKWLTFNDTLSTMNNLYRMEVFGATDTKNLLKSIFRIYKYVNDFTMHYSALEITDKTFENAFEVKKLNLGNNQIKELNVRMFTNMSKIEYFDVSNNLIEIIDPMIFQGLENLQFVVLYSNKILNIEKGTFDNLKLTRLILEDNQLIDFDFWNLNVSTELRLSANQLGDITDNTLSNDIDIKILVMTSNKLTYLNPKFMKHFKKLEYLDLQRNLIEYLQSDVFKGLNNLKTIYLQLNKISIIERGTFYNLNFSQIYFDDNRLVDFDFTNLTAEFIHISSNLLTSLTINGNVINVIAFNNSITSVDIVTRTLKDLGTDKNAKTQIRYV